MTEKPKENFWQGDSPSDAIVQETNYTHLDVRSDSKKQASVFFIEGEVPEVGDEVKFIVTRSETVQAKGFTKEHYKIEINMLVCRK
jgi:hypothetical protein